VKIRSPSDLVRAPKGALVSVGGRARWVRRGDERVVHLFDALASVATNITTASSTSIPIEEDSLVIVDGELVENGGTAELAGCRVLGIAATEPDRTEDVRRLLDGGVGRRLAQRARALAVVREHFSSEGFLEVETPVVLPSPGLDLHLGAFEVKTPAGVRYLSTSPEYQMKRLLVGGIPRCFQLARCFRRDESGVHHNAEFTMLEWYRAFAGIDEVIDDTEAIIAGVLEHLAGPSDRGDADRLDLARPFERISVASAFERFAGVGEGALLAMAAEDPEAFFRIMVERVEPAMAALPRPIVLWRYPRPMASLSRLCPDDPRYAERFEVYARGVELCNGFGELTDPVEQRERFVRDQTEREAAGIPVYPIDERFLDALAGGMPASAGNALGFDRLVMLATGAEAIDDVMAFPTPRL
jgi:elongation factor P--(R)-beta-lysine ligase